jgi:tetratricopeptide (TPR) repeat protein
VELHRRALVLDPEDALAWGNLGTALQAQSGGREEAIECFRRALALNPDFEQARAALETCEEELERERGSRYF